MQINESQAIQLRREYAKLDIAKKIPVDGLKPMQVHDLNSATVVDVTSEDSVVIEVPRQYGLVDYQNQTRFWGNYKKQPEIEGLPSGKLQHTFNLASGEFVFVFTADKGVYTSKVYVCV